VISGHTHFPEVSLISALAGDQRYYLNTGTWRNMIPATKNYQDFGRLEAMAKVIVFPPVKNQNNKAEVPWSFHFLSGVSFGNSRRKADQNNPKGYLEFERVKKLPKGDYDWLAIAQGKAVKIISALLTYLPECYQYKVIFLERDMDEILSSQQRMLERTNKIDEDNKSDEMLRQSYQEHIKKVSTWLEDQDWLQTLYVSYNEILRQPDIEFQKIAVFLDQLVDPQLMAQVVDPELYREKHK